MAISFQQTDSAMDFAANAGCSGATANSTNSSKKSSSGGTAGSVAVSQNIDNSAANTWAVVFECAVPSGATWNAGSWVVRLNVTTTANKLTWTGTFICRVSSSGISKATIGSLTGQSLSLGSTGIQSMTVSGSAQTPAAGDVVVCVLLFSSSNAHGAAQSFAYTPDQLIDSPFTAAANNFTQNLTALSHAWNGITSKQMDIPFSGNSSSFSGQIIKRLSKSLISVGAALTGAINRSISKIIAGTASFLSGTVLKKTSAVFTSVSSAFSASFVRAIVFTKTFAAICASFNGTAIKQTKAILASVGTAFNGAITKKINSLIQSVNAAINGTIAKKSSISLISNSSALSAVLTPAVVFLQGLTAVSHSINGAVNKLINKKLIALMQGFSGSISRFTKAILQGVSHVVFGTVSRITKATLNSSSAAFSGTISLSLFLIAGFNAVSSVFSAVFSATKTGGRTFFQNLSATMSSFFSSLINLYIGNNNPSPESYIPSILTNWPIENIKIMLMENPDTQLWPINIYPDYPNGIPRTALQYELKWRAVPPSAEGQARSKISGIESIHHRSEF